MVLGVFRWNRSTPNGVGSIVSTIASVLLGVLVGIVPPSWRTPSTGRRLLHLLGGGLALIAAGELLSMWTPKVARRR